MTDIATYAALLDDAAKNATSVAQLSASGTSLTLEDAYAVQGQSIARRIARGERLIGVKMGFTSRAKMVQMGVHDLIWGRLTDGMRLTDGGSVDLARFIHPRIEPEIAFLLKKPLAGEVTLLEAQAAVEAVAPALEIIDSRYENFKFSLEDVVADNSSSSGFVIGGWSAPVADLTNLGMIMEFDGQPVQIGSSAGILGNPYRSLVEAARLAGQAGLRLEAGWVVMAGAATAAEALKPGTHVALQAEGLGRVEITAAA